MDPTDHKNEKFKKIHRAPSEIWQPWLVFFGNPENQNSDLKVFEPPEQEFGVRLHFQGCHLFMNSQISSYMGPLKIKIPKNHKKYAKNIIYQPNFAIGL